MSCTPARRSDSPSCRPGEALAFQPDASTTMGMVVLTSARLASARSAPWHCAAKLELLRCVRCITSAIIVGRSCAECCASQSAHRRPGMRPSRHGQLERSRCAAVQVTWPLHTFCSKQLRLPQRRFCSMQSRLPHVSRRECTTPAESVWLSWKRPPAQRLVRCSVHGRLPSHAKECGSQRGVYVPRLPGTPMPRKCMPQSAIESSPHDDPTSHMSSQRHDCRLPV
eukprot:581058-Prymnesium_polylepis.2